MTEIRTVLTPSLDSDEEQHRRRQKQKKRGIDRRKIPFPAEVEQHQPAAALVMTGQNLHHNSHCAEESDGQAEPADEFSTRDANVHEMTMRSKTSQARSHLASRADLRAGFALVTNLET